MPQALKHLVLGLGLLVGLWAGCVPAAVLTKIDDQDRQLALLRQANENLRIAHQRLAAQLENMDRAQWSEKLCKSSRFSTQVAEFIGQVQAASPDVCTGGSFENALQFLRTQSNANALFRPHDGIAAMHIARREYLIDFLAPKNIHPSTRLLVLVQPADDSTEDSQKALSLGEKFVKMMRDEIAPGRELHILGPHLLPCRVRREIQRLFNGPMDVTLPKEPTEGTPRIRIWVFLTNC